MNRTVLSQYTDSDLELELAKRYKEKDSLAQVEPIGLWEVTTEGDCEGRTIKRLGMFQGHIVDIAKMLSPKAYYGLQFASVKPVEVGKVDDEFSTPTTNISLSVGSQTWNMNASKRVEIFKEFLSRDAGENYFRVDKSNYFACVKLNFVKE